MSHFPMLSSRQYLSPHVLAISGLRAYLKRIVLTSTKEDNSLPSTPLVYFLVIPTHLLQEKLFKPVKFTLYFMESFHAKIGHRILVCMPRFRSRLSVLIGLSWHSITSCYLIKRLTFLCRLLSADEGKYPLRFLSP